MLRRSTDVLWQSSHWDRRHFISVVLEAKKDIDKQRLGRASTTELTSLLEKIGPITVRLVLFDRKSFWLVETGRGTVASSSARKCRWVDGGSKSRLKKFMLHDPLIEVLDKAWIELGLVPEKDGYLGSGAFGLVFKVCDQNGVALALKIVPDVDDNVAELQKQMSMTNEAKQKYPHLIFGVEENSFRKFDELGADILFSEVGNHYSSQRKLLLILFKSFTTTMWCMGMLDWTILSTSMGRPSELISKEHIFAKLIKFPRWNRSITKI